MNNTQSLLESHYVDKMPKRIEINGSPSNDLLRQSAAKMNDLTENQNTKRAYVDLFPVLKAKSLTV